MKIKHREIPEGTAPSPPGLILALDCSLNKIGWVVLFPRASKCKDGLDPVLDLGRIESPLKWNRFAKIYANSMRIKILLTLHEPKVVVIENYAFRAKTSSLTTLAENIGGLIPLFVKKGCEIVFVDPKSAKKLATGKGTATKEEMIKAFQKSTRSRMNDEDIADAYWIGQEYLRRFRAGED